MKLFYRQKVLLALLEIFGGSLKNVDIQKYLFLYVNLCQKDKSYNFVPYKYGCFSFQSYADRRKLIELGALMDSDEWDISPQTSFVSQLNSSDATKLPRFYEKYKALKGNDLIKEVYTKYPYYASKSEISHKLLEKDELSVIEDVTNNDTSKHFYTIGYEGKSFEQYLNQLIQNNVRVLCDVRKNPLSRKYGFSKKTLSETLEKLDIEYVHIPELGIISEKRQKLETKQDYNLLFNEYERTVLKDNTDALYQLIDIIKQKDRVAITCFESTPCMCHRGRVAKNLELLPEWCYPVTHL